MLRGNILKLTIKFNASKFLKIAALHAVILIITPCHAQAQDKSNFVNVPMVTISDIELPNRFNAKLPQTIDQMDIWDQNNQLFPPQNHIIDNLVQGDPKIFRKLMEASKSVPNKESTQWAIRWYNLLRFNNVTMDFCNLARPIIKDPKSTLRMAIIGSYVQGCYKEGDHALIIREDTPDSVILDYYSYSGPRDKGFDIPYNNRLASVAAERIMNGKHYEVGEAIFIISNQDDSQAERALITIYHKLSDAEKKDNIALYLVNGKSAEAIDIGIEVCSRKPTKSKCKEAQSPYTRPEKEGPSSELIAKIRATQDQLIADGFVRVANLKTVEIADELNGYSAGEAYINQYMLTEAGYGYYFDVETGVFPNNHDTLLRKLAWIISPELDNVAFEEIAPANDEGLYILDAYSEGKRYRTNAQNLGDWYDVIAVMRLLNTLIVEQKIDARFVVLPTTDQTLTVIGGPQEAINLALKAGLISHGNIGSAEQLGKDFEKEIREDLIKKSSDKENIIIL